MADRTPLAVTGGGAGRTGAPDAAGAPVLLYDGVCGFCNAAVQFVVARDRRRRTMRFAPLQGEFAAGVRARHPGLEGVDSLVLVEPGSGGAPERVRVRTDAALAVASYLGGPWRLAGALRVVPAPLRDLAYDLFARYRYRLFGRHEACQLPAADVRGRFLDL